MPLQNKYLTNLHIAKLWGKDNHKLDEKGYIIDKRIVWSMLSLIIILALFAVLTDLQHFSKQVYIKCDSNSACDNPMWNSKYCQGLDWCSQRTLPANFQYGEPPSWFFLNFDWMVAIILAIAFLTNHFIYNRNKEFKLGEV